MTGRSTIFSALALLFAASAPTPAAQGPLAPLAWTADSFEDGLTRARAEETWMVLFFRAEWSEWSERMRLETLRAPGVIAQLAPMALVDVGVSSPHFEELNERFKPSVFPTLVFVRADGKADEVVAGFVDAEGLVSEITRVEAGVGTLTDLERRVAASPNDLEARYLLGNKRWDLGDDEGYAAELDAILRADPLGRTPTRRRITLQELQEEIRSQRETSSAVDLEPLLDFLSNETDHALLWEGWSALADVYQSPEFEAPALAREAHRKAWAFVPPPLKDAYGLRLAWAFYEQGDSVPQRDRRYALDIAQRSVDRAAQRKDTAVHSRGLYVLAHCFARNGDRATAQATLNNATLLYPTDPSHREALAALRKEARSP